MQRHFWSGRAGWLGAAAWVLCAAAIGAQGAAGAEPQRLPNASGFLVAEEQSVAQPIQPGEYWLGIGTRPIVPELRAHLNLAEGEGLLVEYVVPDSPAAKADLKPHDILLKAGDKALKGIGDLIAAVEAGKDKALALEVLRAGKSMKITVTPQRRPAGAGLPGWQRRGLWPGDADWDTVRKWFEESRPGLGRGPMRFQFFHPGAILPPGTPLQPPLPGNMSVSISKTGNEPAKIVVTRDGKKWEITEKELDRLPADVRPHVERMLGRGWPGSGGLGVFSEVAPAPGAELPRLEPPGSPVVPPGDPAARLEKRLEEMDRRIDQLFKSLEQMHQPAPDSKPAPGKGPEKKPAPGQAGERV